MTLINEICFDEKITGTGLLHHVEIVDSAEQNRLWPLANSVIYSSTALSSLTFYKKLSCRTETARCFVSLNISLSHSESFEMTPLSSS